MTIAGPGAELLAVSGGGQTRVFNVATGTAATLDSLTVSEGSAVDGAGIYNLGELTLRDAIVSHNNATNLGGGIHSHAGAVLNVERSTFTNNTADRGAGISLWNNASSSATIDSSTFTENTAIAIQSVHGGMGGGIYVYDFNAAPVLITNSTLSGNLGTKGAGLLAIGADGIAIVNSTITDNEAKILGISNSVQISAGGIEHLNGAQVTLHNTIVAENRSSAPWRSNTVGSLNAASSYNLLQRNQAGTSTFSLTEGEAGNQFLLWTESAQLAPWATTAAPPKPTPYCPTARQSTRGERPKLRADDGSTGRCVRPRSQRLA